MAARTSRYVREIAATHSPWMIDVVTGGFRRLITKAYVELDYDHEELEALYRMGQRYPLVFLPTHKSHFDHQSLQFALYENGLPPNHTAGGINMNFFPVGPLIRRSGVFFIRREFKDNEAYKFVLRRYIDYLLQRRFPLEWYIEGARSRTGKLLPPKLGMLAYVVEGYQRGLRRRRRLHPGGDRLRPDPGRAELRRRAVRRPEAAGDVRLDGPGDPRAAAALRVHPPQAGPADLAARLPRRAGRPSRRTPTTPGARRFPSSPSRSPTASTR